MRLITEIDNSAFQKLDVVGKNNQIITVNLYFRPTQNFWYMDVSSGTFSATGLKVVSNPNLLEPWYRIIDFGLMCIVEDGTDPMSINDFSTGRAKMYLLNDTDVAYVNQQVFQKVSGNS